MSQKQLENHINSLGNFKLDKRGRRASSPLLDRRPHIRTSLKATSAPPKALYVQPVNVGNSVVITAVAAKKYSKRVRRLSHLSRQSSVPDIKQPGDDESDTATMNEQPGIESMNGQLENVTKHFVDLLQGYIDMSEQVGIITALIMSTCVGLLASLIGHWWDNNDHGIVDWKISGFVTSCVLCIFVSAINILWSFIYLAKYTAVKHMATSLSAQIILSFRRKFVDPVGSRHNPFPDIKKKNVTTSVELHQYESRAMAVFTFASMALFAPACIFGCIVSMSDNDIYNNYEHSGMSRDSLDSVKFNVTERFERNDGYHLDGLEIGMIIIMSVLTAVYLCVLVYGVFRARFSPYNYSTLIFWSGLLDKMVEQMEQMWKPPGEKINF